MINKLSRLRGLNETSLPVPPSLYTCTWTVVMWSFQKKQKNPPVLASCQQPWTQSPSLTTDPAMNSFSSKTKEKSRIDFSTKPSPHSILFFQIMKKELSYLITYVHTYIYLQRFRSLQTQYTIKKKIERQDSIQSQSVLMVE